MPRETAGRNPPARVGRNQSERLPTPETTGRNQSERLPARATGRPEGGD